MEGPYIYIYIYIYRKFQVRRSGRTVHRPDFAYPARVRPPARRRRRVKPLGFDRREEAHPSTPARAPSPAGKWPKTAGYGKVRTGTVHPRWTLPYPAVFGHFPAGNGARTGMDRCAMARRPKPSGLTRRRRLAGGRTRAGHAKSGRSGPPYLKQIVCIYIYLARSCREKDSCTTSLRNCSTTIGAIGNIMTDDLPTLTKSSQGKY